MTSLRAWSDVYYEQLRFPKLGVHVLTQWQILLYRCSITYQPRVCLYWGEPARLPGWRFLPKSHIIPISHSKFVVCSYEQGGWPTRRGLTGIIPGSRLAGSNFPYMNTPARLPRRKCQFIPHVRKWNSWLKMVDTNTAASSSSKKEANKKCFLWDLNSLNVY